VARHTILKERLTAAASPHGSQTFQVCENVREIGRAWHIRQVIRTHFAMLSA
jgi:hypothetical protein